MLHLSSFDLILICERYPMESRQVVGIIRSHVTTTSMNKLILFLQY